MKPGKKKKTETKEIPEDDDGWALSKILLEDRRKRLGYVPEANPLTMVGQPETPASTSLASQVQTTYSVAEAAAILKVSLVTIYRLIQRGKLRYLKSLRHKRIPKTELERFIKQDLG